MSSRHLRLPDAQPASRTPERRTLADLIDRARVLSKRIETIDAALEDVRIGKLEREVADRRNAVEKAKDAAVRYSVDRALGTAGEPPVPISDARLALQAAEDRLETARSTRDVLRREWETAERELEVANRRNNEVRAVVATDPATDALVQAFARASLEFSRLRAAVDVVQLMLTPEQRRLCVIEDNIISPLADEWSAAVAALRDDPDAALPDVA